MHQQILLYEFRSMVEDFSPKAMNFSIQMQA